MNWQILADKKVENSLAAHIDTIF